LYISIILLETPRKGGKMCDFRPREHLWMRRFAAMLNFVRFAAQFRAARAAGRDSEEQKS
jgi:hypothetical protein